MQRPFEVDASEYPFKDHWMPYRDGMIHYVDEGQGPVILLLHGNQPGRIFTGISSKN